MLDGASATGLVPSEGDEELAVYHRHKGEAITLGKGPHRSPIMLALGTQAVEARKKHRLWKHSSACYKAHKFSWALEFLTH